MRTNYLRHLANIVDILWSRPVWGGGGGAQLPIELVNLLSTPKSVTLLLQTNMMCNSVLEVIDGQLAIL